MVADEGSFNRAASKLGRALSVISYGVSSLENQLGVRLFDREGSPRPALTAAGAALLADVRAVADETDSLVARAHGRSHPPSGRCHGGRIALKQARQATRPAALAAMLSKGK